MYRRLRISITGARGRAWGVLQLPPEDNIAAFFRGDKKCEKKPDTRKQEKRLHLPTPRLLILGKPPSPSRPMTPPPPCVPLSLPNLRCLPDLNAILWCPTVHVAHPAFGMLACHSRLRSVFVLRGTRDGHSMCTFSPLSILLSVVVSLDSYPVAQVGNCSIPFFTKLNPAIMLQTRFSCFFEHDMYSEAEFPKDRSALSNVVETRVLS